MAESHVLLAKEPYGGAFCLGKYGQQHIGSGNLLAAGPLDVGRRLRVLEETSRGIRTTAEHERAAKILRRSLSRKLRRRARPAACRRCRSARCPNAKPKFRYFEKLDGTKVEVPVG